MSEKGDDESRALGRRTVLGTAAALGAASLAGCFAGDDDGEGTTADSNAVVVGPGSEYSYAPEEVTTSVEETITWTWDSPNHNVVVRSQPEGAGWEGTDGDASTTYGEDHVYEYAFEMPGTYEYYCQPHEGLGMVGTVVVEE
ncbi:plasmid stabilization protein [Halorubellus sp. JP-L1]|uniref:plastocyanin/azurin family copper-binding protein n=1 Tax=Halorubellus sp. JP-L1 TaxID=2715753 RepID=UPI00140AAECE|nr:plastocyanin/azurin family copper-binding protein [Halorubellus sp. JP-L1]NHN40384.1 plasmid stabilization protein [Halorubellus sp. JP-L1]